MADLKRTVFFDLHGELGAKMVPFAGYEMPVQYPMGVMKEHLHTRTGAGLFDVSHMGQVILRPKSGRLVDAMIAFEALVPALELRPLPGPPEWLAGPCWAGSLAPTAAGPLE